MRLESIGRPRTQVDIGHIGTDARRRHASGAREAYQWPAKDVTQEVFSQAWRQAKRYDQSRAPVGAWLLMITRARAVDVSIADLQYASPSQETSVISAVEAARVRNVLAGLSKAQRTVIELAFYSGLTHAEIADQLREPLGTINKGALATDEAQHRLV